MTNGPITCCVLMVIKLVDINNVLDRNGYGFVVCQWVKYVMLVIWFKYIDLSAWFSSSYKFFGQVLVTVFIDIIVTQ